MWIYLDVREGNQLADIVAGLTDVDDLPPNWVQEPQVRVVLFKELLRGPSLTFFQLATVVEIWHKELRYPSNHLISQGLVAFDTLEIFLRRYLGEQRKMLPVSGWGCAQNQIKIINPVKSFSLLSLPSKHSYPYTQRPSLPSSISKSRRQQKFLRRQHLTIAAVTSSSSILRRQASITANVEPFNHYLHRQALQSPPPRISSTEHVNSKFLEGKKEEKSHDAAVKAPTMEVFQSPRRQSSNTSTATTLNGGRHQRHGRRLNLSLMKNSLMFANFT
ncbi:hypothetical protein PIB30_003770 [Stylosanthes scabra]|uniref:Uncharacterized protein n=1 Tax=Stylosanthes scabra TaxID=79078 RepID=A0ABU6R2E3_9FABA|nr:hypothetical protein [Stylosanthes scabra]